ncbi:hypothetical protein ACFLYR_04280 [Chloroflexota bacterium]
MKNILNIAIIGILALALLIGGATSAYADEGNNGAKITQLPWARLPAADSGLGIDLWTFDEAQQVETPSGNVILIAHFDIPADYVPAKTIKNTGFLVTTWAAGNTYDTQCISTPGGRAFLRAIIHHPKS